MKDTRNMSMRGEAKNTTRKDDDICKNKTNRAVALKSKGAPKKTKVDEVKLGDSKGEEDTPIKWRYYEIETLRAICGEMEEKFAKSARK